MSESPSRVFDLAQTRFGVFGEEDSGLVVFGFGAPSKKREVVTPLANGCHKWTTRRRTISKTRKRATCTHETCLKTPTFGRAGSRRLRCAVHREDGDVNVRYRSCTADGCESRAWWGASGPRRVATHCGVHRLPGSSNLSKRTCVVPGCFAKPRYRAPEGPTSRGERCSAHRAYGDVVATGVACAAEGCSGRPCFVSRRSGARHCLRHHDPETDVGILYVTCQSPGCTKNASFSETRNRPLRCSRHILPGDRDVVNPTCHAAGCSRRPSFAPEGTAPRRCKAHVLEGDVNVTGYRCAHEGCGTIVDRSKSKTCRAHSTAPGE